LLSSALAYYTIH